MAFMGNDDREKLYAYHKGDFGKYRLRWIALQSNNFAIKKDLIVKIGNFDIQFQQRWGMEDIELGYRLTLKKVKFITANIFGYHQFHTTNWKKNMDSLLHNIELFYKKFNNWEIELYYYLLFFGLDRYCKVADKIPDAIRYFDSNHKNASFVGKMVKKYNLAEGNNLLIGFGKGLLYKLISPKHCLDVVSNINLKYRKNNNFNFLNILGIKTNFSKKTFKNVIINSNIHGMPELQKKIVEEASRIGRKVFIFSKSKKVFCNQRFKIDYEKSNKENTFCYIIQKSAAKNSYDFPRFNFRCCFDDGQINTALLVELALQLFKLGYETNLQVVTSKNVKQKFKLKKVFDESELRAMKKLTRSDLLYGSESYYHVGYLPLLDNLYFFKNCIGFISSTFMGDALNISHYRTMGIHEKLILNQCFDMMCCDTKFSKNILLENNINHNHLYYSPLGVNIDLFNNRIKPYNFKCSKKTKLLFMGYPDKNSGYDLLLDAYFSSFQKNDDISLHIVIPELKNDCRKNPYLTKRTNQSIKRGKDYQLSFLNDRVNSLKIRIKADNCLPEVKIIEKNILFRELPKYFNYFDCLVYPFRENQDNYLILLAMACGIPAIVPKCFGTEEYCNQENSFIIKSKRMNFISDENNAVNPNFSFATEPDLNSLRRQMKYIYENRSSLKSKGRNAMKYVHKNYNTKKAAQHFVKNIKKSYSDKYDNKEYPFTDHYYLEKHKILSSFLIK